MTNEEGLEYYKETMPLRPSDAELLRQAGEALRKVTARADEAISCLPKGAQTSALNGGGFVFPLDNDTAMDCRAVLALIDARTK